MVAQIVSLFSQCQPPKRDWTQQETAEFYRVESALVQAGVQLESDRGLSDEGDPWFIFCRADNGEVFIHFARIDGFYVVDGVAFETPARGRDFNALVKSLISTYPVAAARARGNSNIFVHPAALLIALVGAAFFQTNEAKASTTAGPDAKIENRRSSLIVASGPQPTSISSGSTPPSGDIDASQAGAILLSAILTVHEETVVAAARSVDGAPIAATQAPQGLTPVGTSTTTFTVARSEPVAPAQLEVASFAAAPKSDADAQVTAALVSQAASFSVSSPAEDSANLALEAGKQAVPTQSISFAAAKPLFFLKFSSAPLPSVEAIAVVAENAALADLVAKTMPQVDRLPSSILDLINRGEHLNASPPALNHTQTEGSASSETTAMPASSGASATTPSNGLAALTQGPTATPQSPPVEESGSTPVTQAGGAEPTTTGQPTTSAGGPITDVASQAAGAPVGAPAGDVAAPQSTATATLVTPAPSSQGSTTQVSPTPGQQPTTNATPFSEPTTVIATSAAAKPSAAAQARDAAISAAITEFMKYVPHVDMILQGKQLVLYDRDILDPLAGKMDLASVTINFDDGSSLSLVGTVGDLSHFHWPI